MERPQPIGGFAWVQAAAGAALVCRALEPLAPHVFTTRGWILGSAQDGHSPDGWAQVADTMGVAPAALARMHQVHGATVVVRRADERARAAADRPDADIVVSDDPSLALSVQTADCVPLLIADGRTGAVCAAHAGWRGLAAHVPPAAVEALRREFGSRAEDLVAAIGPSIGACCYEVGADVRAAFTRGGFSQSNLARWFFDGPQPTVANPSMPSLEKVRRAAHWFFDGWSAAGDQLEAAGVPAAQIHVAGLCTASHPEHFCSYRRDGTRSGRNAAAVRVRPRGLS